MKNFIQKISWLIFGVSLLVIGFGTIFLPVPVTASDQPYPAPIQSPTLEKPPTPTVEQDCPRPTPTLVIETPTAIDLVEFKATSDCRVFLWYGILLGMVIATAIYSLGVLLGKITE